MTYLRVDVDFDALEHLISDAIGVLSAEGTVTAWSAAAASLTGITREDAVGRSLDELFARVDPPLGFAAVPMPVTLLTNDERRRAIHGNALSLDEGWFVSFGAQQRYDAIDQLKHEIIAAVSHELKTPIASIKAYATTLRENSGIAEADRAEYLSTIEQEADRLAHAVDQLLLAGRVDAEYMLTHRERLTAGALLDLALARLSASAAARVERATGDVALGGDPELLSIALAHLLDNALKFSGHETPVVVEAAASDGAVLVRVRDRGIGIATEHLPYIFERFYRSERSLTAPTGGYGLGLFVAREIARAHGGAIDVESAALSGSAFTLRIPERA